MALETTTTLANDVKQFYDLNLLDNAFPNLIHTQWAQTRNIPGGVGRSMEFRRFGVLTAATTPLTEGVVPAETNMSVALVTATIDQYGAYLKGTDVLLMTAIDPLLEEYSELLGAQMGDTIDQIVRDVLVAGTSVRYANGKGSRGDIASGDNVNTTELRKLLRTLENNNARPVDDQGNFGLMIHPNVYYDIISDTTVQNALFYASARGNDNPLFSGEVGRFMGFVFVKSTNAKWFSGAGVSNNVDVYVTMAIGKDAYGITELEGESVKTYYKAPGSAGTTDPLEMIWTYGWKLWFGAVRLNENWMVRLESAASP